MIPFSVPEVQIPLRHFLSAGDTYFDVGAHQAWVAGPAAYLLGPKGHAVCFEPNAANMNALLLNIRSVGLTNITTVASAVYHTTGSIRFFENPLPHTSGIYLQSPVGSREIIVPTIALDDYIELTGYVPVFLKVDVEGAEMDVLRGAQKLIEEKKPIFLLETRPEDAEPFEYLRARGYRAFNVLAFEEVKSADVLARGRAVDDLLYLPSGVDPGPFGRTAGATKTYQIHKTGSNLRYEVPLKPGMNRINTWVTSPGKYSLLSCQAEYNGRIVVNAADQIVLMFDPSFPTVIYSGTENVAVFHLECVHDVTVEKATVSTIPMTDAEIRRHNLLSITSPLGLAV